MRTSLPTAIIGLVLLSTPGSAHPHLRAEERDESAPENPIIIYSTYTVIPMPVTSTTALNISTFSAVPMSTPEVALPAIITETYDAVPVPTESATTPATSWSTFEAISMSSALEIFSTHTAARETFSASSSSNFTVAAATPTVTSTGTAAGVFFTRSGTGCPHATGSVGATAPSPQANSTASTRTRSLFTLNDPSSTPTPTPTPTPAGFIARPAFGSSSGVSSSVSTSKPCTPHVPRPSRASRSSMTRPRASGLGSAKMRAKNLGMR
ncbi:uncharacterized protein RAG0_01719 [Rhynchosporium agropyri]|uniref:Uncharacterized protein n=1 Tax=Rhynchosporium agropyri TaxID=914238 RepID=A0A1E1JYM1_9HELO|nr:uncharacterized protein RAG0_01719 [Rhynchosporium agropyri]